MHSSAFLRFFLLLFGFGLFANGCGCGDEDDEIQSYFSCVILKEGTGDNIYGWKGFYPENELVFFAEDGSEIELATVNEEDGLISFPLVYPSEEIAKVYAKNFYLALSASDIDTVNIEYVLRAGKCEMLIVESIAVRYNNEIFDSNSQGIYEFLKRE